MGSVKGPYFIGIDAGTQGLRTGILDLKGNILSSHEEFYNTYYPNINWAEQKPQDWWKALKNTLKNCLSEISEEEKNNIVSLAICATSSTVLPIDENGEPLRDAILWMDSRAKKEAELINKKGHEILKYCGGEVSVEWMIPKVLWLKNNERALYDKSYKIIEELDWLNYKLTNKYATSKCTATCKWNYTEDLGGWNSEYFEQIGLEDYKEKLVLDVKGIGETVGVVSDEIAKEFGLPSNIKVIQGGIDAHVAMFGMGVTTPGKLATIMGTSFVQFALSKEPIFQEGIWGPYNKAVLPEYWLLEGGQVSAGSITKWFIDSFKVEGDNPYTQMIEEASKISIGSDGVVVLDFFQGNRTPYKDPNAKGVIYGLNLVHTRAHIYRAILESVAFGTRNIVENFEKQNYKLDTIVGCGGIVKNKLWLQMISDVTGKPIIVNKNSVAGIVGCGVVASVGANVYEDFVKAGQQMVQEDYRVNPNMENYKEYTHSYKKYLKIYDSLKDVMHEK